jgi:hypothetical protein
MADFYINDFLVTLPLRLVIPPSAFLKDASGTPVQYGAPKQFISLTRDGIDYLAAYTDQDLACQAALDRGWKTAQFACFDTPAEVAAILRSSTQCTHVAFDPHDRNVSFRFF